jgi:PAS domain S-box-containing protein
VCNRAKDGSLFWVDTIIAPFRDADGRIEKYVSLRSDITARKQAELELNESESRHRLLIDTALDALVAMDERGVVTLWNPQAERTFGFTREDAVGRDLDELVIPERLRAAHRAGLARYLSTGEARVAGRRIEVPAVRKDGVEITIELAVTPVRTERGALFSAFLRDITERKRAEEAIQAASGMLRRTGTMARVGGWELEVATRKLTWSDEVYRIHEVEPGTPITVEQAIAFYAPRARAPIAGAVEAGLVQGTPWDLELPLITAKGTPIWVRAQGEAIVRDGAVVRLCGAFQDVTERTKARQELENAHRDLESRVQERTAELSEAYARLQGEAAEREKAEGQAQEARDRARTMVGYLVALDRVNLKLLECDSVEHIGQTVTEALVHDFGGYFARLWRVGPGDRCAECPLAEHCPDRAQCLHLVASAGHYTHIDGPHGRVPIGAFKIGRIAQGMGKVVSNDVQHDERVHDRIWAAEHGLVSFAGLPLHQKGRIVGVVAMFSRSTLPADLVEVLDLFSHSIVAAIDNVEQRLAVAAASRAKSDFLACMSHELRTPLNGVLGMVDLLQRTPLDAGQQRYALLAKSSGEMLLALIKDILDFSKIEVGKLELDHTDFCLRTAIESVATNLAAQAEAKGLELICGVHPLLVNNVRGDPGRLQQVLANLLGNAVKFTESGHVVVRATPERDDGDHCIVRFTVTDTGIGISGDKIERLFRSFSQADTSMTRRFGGTGLGLAISKRLVELMGGEIGVASEPGSGSTFWFTARLERGAPKRPRRSLGDLRSMRVLIVDDNEINREILTEHLCALGLTCDAVAGAPEALERLREEARGERPFDMAILDMQMPHVDGEQLARVIRSEPAMRQLPLVLATSVGLPSDEAHLRQIGFSGWLCKPATQSQLVDAIVEAMACAGAGAALRLDDLPTIEAVVSIPKAARPARILVVEDNAIGQEVAVTILQSAGYECETACNGREAVERTRTTDPDLVLMDCQMPEMDGFEATRAIRREEADRGGDRKLPIVALTANALKGDEERCLAAGMNGYLTKPLDPAKLLSTIDRYLAAKREVAATGDSAP